MTSRRVAATALAWALLAFAGTRLARADGPPADTTRVSSEPPEIPVLQLTSTPTLSERQPAWSPDGRWIAAVVADSAGRPDLWLLSSDGKSRRRATDDGLVKGSPAWSPDGKRLAFHCAREKSIFRIWVLDLDDSTSKAITDDPGRTMGPAWSPDGAEVTYFGIASGDEQVWSIPLAGGAARRLTYHKTQSWSAAWSPDGKEIVFSGYRNEKTGGSLFVMPREGEGEACERSRALTHRTDHGWDRFPSWSPDGRWVAFAARGGSSDFDIWLVSSNGSTEVRVTDDPAIDTEPSWAPDGRRLVFESNRSGNDDLWIVDVSRWTAAGAGPR